MHPTERSVAASIQVAASASKLWACWTEPELLNAWYTVSAAGEPKTGEFYQWKFDEFFGPAQVLKVQQVDPGHSMMLSTDQMLIGIRIQQEGQFGEVEVIQAGFGPEGQDDARYQGCSSGWKMALGQLKFYLENYDGQPRKEVLLLEPVTSIPPATYRFFADSGQRGKWLTVDDAPRDSIVETGREVLLRWDAIGGTLELKAFEWGPQSYLCLRASSWSKDYDLSWQRPALAESLKKLKDLAR